MFQAGYFIITSKIALRNIECSSENCNDVSVNICWNKKKLVGSCMSYWMQLGTKTLVPITPIIFARLYFFKV